MRVLVDAEVCPTKGEICRVALRRDVPRIVSNARLRVLPHPLIARTVVSGDVDAADDRIAERANTRVSSRREGGPPLLA